MRVFIPFFLFAVAAGSFATQPVYLSPYDIDKGDSSLYVTASTAGQIVKVDLETRKVSGRFELPFDPTASVLSADGSTLYVVGGGDRGIVCALDAQTGELLRQLPVGHTPFSPVLSPDGAMLYVCNRFNDSVSFIDLAEWKETACIKVVREPIAADISMDGRQLFVANHIPAGRADAEYVASLVSVIDTESLEVKNIRLVNGAEGVRGMKLSPDGQYMFATHFMARFLVPTTQISRGWVSTDALSVIRVSDQTLLYTVLLDDMSKGFSNPWAIGFSADAKTMVVSSAANHELSFIDYSALMRKVEEEAKKTKSGEVHLDTHNNLSFLVGIRTRAKLAGKGPRSMVVEGSTAYVANYFSDSVDMVDFVGIKPVGSESVELNPGVELTLERQGEIFFYDSSLCFQNWLSCSTCHPDARNDAMNWDLLNDGIGNPKNVKSMLLVHATPRTTWLGIRADAETSVRAGIKHIQFAVRPEEDAQAIDAYLKSLEPVPSPYLENGEMSESGVRGGFLFNDLGCVACHSGPLYTNMKIMDVGTTRGLDAGKPVDTPSLVEVWRTAPYLHDGRAATMRDLLLHEDHAGICKMTSELSEQELKDLETYILSL